MFGKNKNKKVGLCVMVVTACLVMAGIWAVLATPETALAKKPDKPGGGEGGQPCVIFDDFVGDSVQSDGQDPDEDDKGLPYCHNKKEKITVKFSNDGHLTLDTNSTDKAAAGRGLFIDFGTDVTLAPGTVNEMVITTTDDALFDIYERVLGVSADLRVGAPNDNFNFFNMDVGSDEDVNLTIRVWFYFTDGSTDSLLIRLAPNPCTNRHCPSSDSVTVTYDGINEDTQLHEWRVETQTVVKGACISRSGECEEGDTDSDGDACLLDVDDDDPDLDPGHIALSFGFTVTAAP